MELQCGLSNIDPLHKIANYSFPSLVLVNLSVSKEVHTVFNTTEDENSQNSSI